MSKKVISLLLAIMLTVSMVAVAAVSVSAEVDDEGRYVPTEGTETNRYYFYMPNDWLNDCAFTAGIYWWQGTDAAKAWPGYNAQPGDVAGVYYADVPSDVATIIWNNGFDGGDDETSEDYAKAIQTMNIGAEFYDEGESDLYPAGTESFDNMIYVVDPGKIDVSDFSGKMMCGGEWYYYYGNGEYGVQPTKEEAVAAGALFNTEYQPPKGGPTPTEPTPTEEVPTEPTPTEAVPTEPTPTEPVVDSAPYLTVNATSNYFPKATAEYNAETNEVTVTYWFKSSKDMLDTQWYISYDRDVLSVSSKNTPMTICPTVGRSAVLNLDTKEDHKIKYNASNLGLYDFSKDSVFAQIIFDVKDISASAPVTTTVDLTVDVLRVSALDPNTFQTATEEEVILVNNCEVASAPSVEVTRRTTLTESTYVEPTTAEPVPTEPVPTEPATTEPVPTEPTDVLNLTVNATSNYFPEAKAEYNPTTEEVTVTYYFQSAKQILDTQWYMTYDSEILTLSEKNSVDTVCPTMASTAVLNLSRENTIYFNASNLGLYDFTTEAPFAQVVFDVNDISAIAPVTTTIDLTVEVLRVSELAEGSTMTDSSKEEILVNNGKVVPSTLVVVRRTALTESTYVEPTTAPIPTEPTPTEPTPTEPVPTDPTPTEPAETDPTPTEPAETDPTTPDVTPTVPDEGATDATSATGATSGGTSTSDTPSGGNSNNNNGAVQTGDASLAVIILTLLVVATGVMLALRKRDALI